jgi:N-acetylglutamate synthase-like GNAT family acetyltransferase
MRIEEAQVADMPLIEAAVRRMKLDGERLAVEQFIVARDGDRLLGFGRIKPYEGSVYELGTVGVLEEARGHGVGASLVEELIRRFPSEDVYITTDLVDWFQRFGFSALAEVPPVLQEKLTRVCASLRTGVVAMARRRS